MTLVAADKVVTSSSATNSIGGTDVSFITLNGDGTSAGATEKVSVGGLLQGDVAAAVLQTAVAADEAFAKAKKIVEDALKAVDDGNGGIKKGSLTDVQIAALNLFNKEGSMAMAANQQFTALLSKIERMMQTQA
jgi:hypothetical protein